ncbi:hypothetical protein ACH4SK_40055 [Streptomyces inhibens]|uniref:hypothetical protein n=1 Tax=Streptomyces inhibens TaxID=2293571 RepID=UPI0037B1E9E2
MSGVLALIPVLTPIAGPIAAVTALGSLAAHATDIGVRGDWDSPKSWITLGTDVLGALPGMKAVAGSVKTGAQSMRAVGKATIAVRAGGRAFLAETGGRAASEAAPNFSYLGQKVAGGVGKSVSEAGAKSIAKVMQGSANLLTQVPTTIDLAGGDSGPVGNVTNGLNLISTGAQSGSWGLVGKALQPGKDLISVLRFAKALYSLRLFPTTPHSSPTQEAIPPCLPHPT